MDKLTLRTMPEILDAIVPVIGYYPVDSIVVVVVRDGLLVRTMRWDLELVEAGGGVWLTEKLGDRELGLGLGCRVLVVGYGELGRARVVVKAVVEELGPVLLDAVIVDGGRWYYLDGDETGRSRCSSLRSSTVSLVSA
ncbi:MAG: DUF4192 family protein [Propionibacteriaceae bacterium]|nr:DUF4192 family protein [Propionibacteriaceae bacterium]